MVKAMTKSRKATEQNLVLPTHHPTRHMMRTMRVPLLLTLLRDIMMYP